PGCRDLAAGIDGGRRGQPQRRSDAVSGRSAWLPCDSDVGGGSFRARRGVAGGAGDGFLVVDRGARGAAARDGTLRARAGGYAARGPFGGMAGRALAGGFERTEWRE